MSARFITSALVAAPSTRKAIVRADLDAILALMLAQAFVVDPADPNCQRVHQTAEAALERAVFIAGERELRAQGELAKRIVAFVFATEPDSAGRVVLTARFVRELLGDAPEYLVDYDRAVRDACERKHPPRAHHAAVVREFLAGLRDGGRS